jgi:hypothetical protein
MHAIAEFAIAHVFDRRDFTRGPTADGRAGDNRNPDVIQSFGVPAFVRPERAESRAGTDDEEAGGSRAATA